MKRSRIQLYKLEKKPPPKVYIYSFTLLKEKHRPDK